MEITKRKFQNAFALANRLSEQGLTIVKMTPDGKSSEEELIKRGSAVCWCAKEFVESPINTKIIREIEKKQRELTRTHCLKDKETKALLYESKDSSASGANQFDAPGMNTYEDALLKLMDEKIDFKDVDLFICPKEDMVTPVPAELEPLNNLVVMNSFWRRVVPIKSLPEDAPQYPSVEDAA